MDEPHQQAVTVVERRDREATICLGFLSPRRAERQVLHHTDPRLPTFAQTHRRLRNFPRDENSRPESGAPNPFLPQGAPPGPSRIPRIPAEIPRSSAFATAAAASTSRCASPTRVFFPKGPSLLPWCGRPRIVAACHRGDLVPAGPGLFSAVTPSRPAPPRLERRRPVPFRRHYRRRRLTGSGVARGGDPPGRGSISLPRWSCFLQRAKDQSIRGVTTVYFPENSGVQLNPHAPR